MAGHSHWANIARKKALVDSKRGKLWSKLSKAIIVAAKSGGGDVDMNLKLRYAIDAAKAVSMPKDNIARAIKRGTGELEGVHYEEVNYEGYGPGGVAIMANTLTDNRNRTVAELRRVFEKHGGNIGAAGCVAWMFQKRGLLTVEPGKAEEERLMEIALDAGADDVRDAGGVFEVVTAPNTFEAVKSALTAAGIDLASAEVTMVPQNTVSVTGQDAERAMKLLEELDDHDDVQSVASNIDIAQEEMERLSAA